MINAGIVERDPAATAALSVENFGEWLTANFTPFWDNVTVPMEPAIYKKVGKCAFVPEAKPGFMPTMTVLFPVEFGPPDGECVRAARYPATDSTPSLPLSLVLAP